MDEINSFLEEYKLFGYQHRVVLCLSLFGHKIENIPNAPPLLKEQLLYSKERNIPYSFRKTSITTYYLPITNNHYGEQTFKYFFNKFLEKTCIDHIKKSFLDFRKIIILNINNICDKFIDTFDKFDISYK
jgi:exonuclease III